MARGGTIGHLARIGYSDPAASPPVWNVLEEVTDIEVPQEVADKLDSSTYNGGLRKQNIPGLSEVSDTVVTMWRDADPATSPIQNALFALNAARTIKLWRVELHSSNDPSVDMFEAYQFLGRLGGYQPTAPNAEIQELKTPIIFTGEDFDQFAPAASELGAPAA